MGFGIGTAAAVFVGAAGGFILQHSVSYSAFTQAVLSAGSVLVVGLMIGWVLLGESDQGFGLIYAASMALSSAVLAPPSWAGGRGVGRGRRCGGHARERKLPGPVN